MRETGPVEGRALWHIAPGRAEIRPEIVGTPQRDEARIRTLWSGISRGTERLVAEGRVPPSEHARMRCPLQAGTFSFPVKYGYCAVGEVEDGPADWKGATVFALAPHQDHFVTPLALMARVPDIMPPRRAILAANMETALNALWDTGAGPGDRIAIVGAGVVGLLVAFLAAGLPGAEVTVIDPAASRETIAQAFGAGFTTAPPKNLEADFVVHASATPAGLATAIDVAGAEARIVELSWYGEGTVAAPLGGAFHAKRLQLVASQVRMVAPSRRPRWDHGRRLAKAIALCADPRLDALITGEVAFEDLPHALPRLLAAGAPGLCTAISYR